MPTTHYFRESVLTVCHAHLAEYGENGTREQNLTWWKIDQHLQLIQAVVKWENFSGALIINENLHFYKQI